MLCFFLAERAGVLVAGHQLVAAGLAYYGGNGSAGRRRGGQGQGEDGPAGREPGQAGSAAAPPFMIELSQAWVSVPPPRGAALAAAPNKVASAGPRHRPASGAATGRLDASTPYCRALAS